ncbi:MAG: hypothetical protein AAFP08_02515 [Bacteroidota bacterium]
MSSMRFAVLFFVLPLVGFFSCNPEEQEPAYVTFEGFNLSTGINQGSNSSAIENVWVFADNVYLGTYSLPARIPMLLSGPTTLRFEAGVKENGISSTPQIYPFYQAATVEADLIPGEITAVGRQNISYRSNAVFGFIESFEPDEQRVFNTVIIGNGPIQTTATDVFEGDGSGLIRLTDSNNLVEILADPIFEALFDQGVEPRIWLEMDFKSEATGLVGLVGTNLENQLFRSFNPGFLPREEWTKIYFNLSEIYFSSRANLTQAGITAFLPEEMNQADILLDNVKLVYR